MWELSHLAEHCEVYLGAQSFAGIVTLDLLANVLCDTAQQITEACRRVLAEI